MRTIKGIELFIWHRSKGYLIPKNTLEEVFKKEEIKKEKIEKKKKKTCHYFIITFYFPDEKNHDARFADNENT